MKELSSAERRALRSRAHALHPIVMIGSAGLTPAVLREIDLALKNHELIKIRMLGEEREAREQAMERICESLDANAVQMIGKILVVHRPAPEPEAPPAPRPARTETRRTKGKPQKRGKPQKNAKSHKRRREYGR